MLTTLIVAILSATPLSPALAVALAIPVAPLLVFPDDIPKSSLTPRFFPMTDNSEPSNGHIVPKVAIAMAVVLSIFISFVVGLCWLYRWRPGARRECQTSTSRPTNVYNLQTYSHKIHHVKAPSSTISGSDVESLRNSPGTVMPPAEAHLPHHRSATTAGMLDLPRSGML